MFVCVVCVYVCGCVYQSVYLSFCLFVQTWPWDFSLFKLSPKTMLQIEMSVVERRQFREIK